MLKYFFSVFVIILSSTFVTYPVDAENYCRVQVFTTSPSDILRLQSRDINIEHYRGNFKTGIILELNSKELSELNKAGLPYEVLITNLKQYYTSRPLMTATDVFKSLEIMKSDNVSGFGYGSMGGFYTYNEIGKVLDTLRTLYPNLITSKQTIGTTHEGRAIWSVKITENADINHSATRPAVYFDALHHAREPMSFTTLIYYMFWLVENYGTNPEATYLLKNREIFFIPVVNPDGYVYNQTTNPNGGGMWRKNRRDNGGSFGVDLNRNYGYGWGIGSGSSSVPGSETYRGPSPFSEPESQAVWNFVDQINPSVSFTMHSVAGRYLNPYGYTDTSIAYELYSDFSSEFAVTNNYLYGSVKEMLNYYSAGTTRDHFHVNGTLCWTTEVGGSDFWPGQSEIIPLCSENLPALKYLSWVSGAFARLQQVKVAGDNYAYPNDTMNLIASVRNKGMRISSKNVKISVISLSPNAMVITPIINIDSIPSREIKDNVNDPVKISIDGSASIGSEFKLIFKVEQENITTSVDTISFRVGKQQIIFSDDAESGNSNWIKSGTQNRWDTTFVGFYSPLHSFASSRYGNSANNAQNYYMLNRTVSLTNSYIQNPFLEFSAKWADESNYDYTRIQLSTNNGNSWINLTGAYTKQVSGAPSYTGIQYWVYERISLNQYTGQDLKFRFYYKTDNGVPGDGFYFDDFKVVDYEDNPSVVSQNGNVIPEKYSLFQNFPNPFNPVTSIKFSLKDASNVKLFVYDLTGKQIATLLNEFKNPGVYTYSFNANGLSSGTYIYSIEAMHPGKNDLLFKEIKKMVLIK